MPAAALLLVAACGGGGGGGPSGPDDGGGGGVPPPVQTGTIVVNLTDNVIFSPADVRITPGSTIRWVNSGFVFHTVTPQGHNAWARHDMSRGDVFEVRFNQTGSFDYFCEPHRANGMTGNVTVVAQ